MKSRSKELLDRAVAATVAAIEIYDKPDFPYRAETFCILAINGWELLLKANWLNECGNTSWFLHLFGEMLHCPHEIVVQFWGQSLTTINSSP